MLRDKNYKTENWMQSLAQHYKDMKLKYPKDNLLLIFDIDDTIVDIRLSIMNVLWRYDRERGSHWFRDIMINDVDKEQRQFDEFLQKMAIPEKYWQEIRDFLEENLWTEGTILASHTPFRGVLEVIRWFQLQENTDIGLNTGRGEHLREVTLQSLNTLGKEYRVKFTSEMLYMNPGADKPDYVERIHEYKAEGVRYYENMGYKVISMIDNEPANLHAISEIIADPDILLLHADTLYGTSPDLIPGESIPGDEYDIVSLIAREDLPRHIAFVWDGVNSQIEKSEFISSNINWAEMDVIKDPVSNELVVRHENFNTMPRNYKERLVNVRKMIKDIHRYERSMKFALKENGGVLQELLEIIDEVGVPQERLWFNFYIERFTEDTYQSITEKFPDAIVSAYIDFLIPIVVKMPERAKEILEELTSWGFNRFSISFASKNRNVFMDRMDDWGYEVEIRNVYSLDDFLRAVVLNPVAITSNFAFPRWKRYNREI